MGNDDIIFVTNFDDLYQAFHNKAQQLVVKGDCAIYLFKLLEKQDTSTTSGFFLGAILFSPIVLVFLFLIDKLRILLNKEKREQYKQLSTKEKLIHYRLPLFTYKKFAEDEVYLRLKQLDY